MLDSADDPVCGNHPNPFHAGVFHRPVAADALSDGLSNDGLLKFLVVLNGCPGLLKDGIDFRAFVIKEVGDAALFIERWDYDLQFFSITQVYS